MRVLGLSKGERPDSVAIGAEDSYTVASNRRFERVLALEALKERAIEGCGVAFVTTSMYIVSHASLDAKISDHSSLDYRQAAQTVMEKYQKRWGGGAEFVSESLQGCPSTRKACRVPPQPPPPVQTLGPVEER